MFNKTAVSNSNGIISNDIYDTNSQRISSQPNENKHKNSNYLKKMKSVLFLQKKELNKSLHKNDLKNSFFMDNKRSSIKTNLSSVIPSSTKYKSTSRIPFVNQDYETGNKKEIINDFINNHSDIQEYNSKSKIRERSSSTISNQNPKLNKEDTAHYRLSAEQSNTILDRFFITGNKGELEEWSVMKNSQQKDWKQIHLRKIRCVKITPNGRQVLTADDGGSLKLWSFTTKRLLHDYGRAHNGWIGSLVVSYNGLYVFTGGEFGMLKQWSLPNNM